MQFFKSTVVGILAFSAYAITAALPEPKALCGDFENSCTPYDWCCLGFKCDYSSGNGLVSMDPKYCDAKTDTLSGDQCIPILLPLAI
jgi:hypothetical protein